MASITNLDGTSNIDDYLKAYRASLVDQYNAAVANLDTQKQSDQASIMSKANAAGMLYSNFPQRERTKYIAGTYTPARAKLRSTYQTGLDKLRSNTVDIVNNISTIEQAIADLGDYGVDLARYGYFN